MAAFDQIVSIITNQSISQDFKDALIKDEELTPEDLIDIANYVSIERNFYVRRCEKLKSKIESKKQ